MVATTEGLAELYTLYTTRLRRAKLTSSLEETTAVVFLTLTWLVAGHHNSA